MTPVTVFDPERPPLTLAVALLSQLLQRQPRRLAFAGRAGAGKTTMCELLAGRSALLPDAIPSGFPIINNADGIKAEVMEWLVEARTRHLIPEEEATKDHFLDYLGLSPAMVKAYMWDLIGPLWEAMKTLLEDAYRLFPPLDGWLQYARGEGIEAKVAFVDAHKPIFRTALQKYGEAVKELAADPFYWVNETVNRSLAFRTCFNGDIRFTEEADALKGAGWTTIYLWIDDETQKQRRPDLTPEQLAHASENGIAPEDCDFVIDATRDLARVVYDTALVFAPARQVAIA